MARRPRQRFAPLARLPGPARWTVRILIVLLVLALLLYDPNQIVVARAMVPVRRMDPDLLARLAQDLEEVFGKGWME